METKKYNDEKIIDESTLSQMAVAYASTLKAFENAEKFLSKEKQTETYLNNRINDSIFHSKQLNSNQVEDNPTTPTISPTQPAQTFQNTDAILREILEEIRQIKAILIFNRRIRLS